jgi:toxin secretion/phage lysis holin
MEKTNTFIHGIQGFLTVAGFALGWFFGELDGILIALLVFIATDYLTGVAVAIKNRKLSSEVGFVGLLKKVMILGIVGIAHILDMYVLGDSAMLRTAVIFFYMSNEGISIMENVAGLGVPIPDKLKAVLEQLNKDDEKTEEEEK